MFFPVNNSHLKMLFPGFLTNLLNDIFKMVSSKTSSSNCDDGYHVLITSVSLKMVLPGKTFLHEMWLN